MSQPLDDVGSRPRLGAGLLAREPFQRPNRNRPIVGDEPTRVIDARDRAAATGRLARGSADAAADGGKGIGTARDEVRLLKVALGNGAHITTRVGVNWAGNLTGDKIPVMGRTWDLHAELRRGHRSLPARRGLARGRPAMSARVVLFRNRV